MIGRRIEKGITGRYANGSTGEFIWVLRGFQMGPARQPQAPEDKVEQEDIHQIIDAVLKACSSNSSPDEQVPDLLGGKLQMH